ncbi:hypothetical protein HQO90_07350 [Rhodococcus fascians]|nr:hypothetical protein [Rhodococcus fascians]
MSFLVFSGSSNDTPRAIDRVVCGALLDAAVDSGEIAQGQTALELMRAVGNLCIGATDPRYDPRKMARVLVAGLRITTEPDGID